MGSEVRWRRFLIGCELLRFNALLGRTADNLRQLRVYVGPLLIWWTF